MPISYMTPGGAGLNDGTSPGNAFDWTGFVAWQIGVSPGDILYVGPGTYTGTDSLLTATDGDSTALISVIGVSSLTTLAEPTGDARPLFAMNAARVVQFDNFWSIRNVRITGDHTIALLRADNSSFMTNCQSTNSGTGEAFRLGSTSLWTECEGESALGQAFIFGSFGGKLLGCIIKNSLIGVSFASSPNHVVGCVIRNCTTGLSIGNTDRHMIVGNTFYQNATAISIGALGDRQAIARNIFASCPASIVGAVVDKSIQIDHNVWFDSGDPVNHERGPNALLVDPQFVDPVTFDFRVRNEAVRRLGINPYTTGAVAPSIFDGGQTNISGDTTPDYSGDQLFREPLETVQLDGAEVQNVYRNSEEEIEQEDTQGVYLSRLTTFDFPVGETIYPGNGRPQVASTIIDGDGNGYVILSIKHPYLSNFWGCRTRSSVLADTFDLDDTVTLLVATYTKDPGLGKKTSHTPDATFTDVAAKIMLRSSDSEQSSGQDQFVERYDVYVDQDIGQVNNGDLLRDGNGKLYQIVSYRDRLNFEENSVMECELRQVP